MIYSKLNQLWQLVIMLGVMVSVTGCATMFRGYEDKLIIRNLSDSMQVFTSEGVELKVFKDKERIPIKLKEKLITGSEVETVIGESENKYQYSYIFLPTKRDYILVIKDGEKETRYEVYPTIEIGWFLLDCLFPLALIVDLYTGNINGYTELRLKK